MMAIQKKIQILEISTVLLFKKELETRQSISDSTPPL